MRARAAFTLVETVVALAVSGLIVASLGVLIWTAQQTGFQVRAELGRHGEAFVSSARIGDLLSRVHRAGNTFEGEPHRLRVRSRCERPGGWLGPCEVQLRLAASAAGTDELQLLLDGRQAFAVEISAGAHFVYGVVGSERDVWLSRIAAGAMVPDLIAVVRQADTVRYGVGAPP